jgi:hypothetical protein
MGEEAHMDAMHVLTDATGRGWRTSEFVLACVSIAAILWVAPSAGHAMAIGIVTAAYAIGRSTLKAATSRALLSDVEPPIRLVERPVEPERSVRPLR